jgi:hypothetical protein
VLKELTYYIILRRHTGMLSYKIILSMELLTSSTWVWNLVSQPTERAKVKGVWK